MNYQYDLSTVPNSIGHLTQVDNGVSTTKFLSFDVMGRTTSSSQTTGSVAPPSFSYVYNQAGDLEKLTLPSGRSVTTCYDGANRIASVSGKATPTATATTYASGPTSGASIQYAPHGAIRQMKLGNGLFEQTTFNPRLQLIDVNLGTSLSAKNDVWGIVNRYDPGDPTINNGNLLMQIIYASGNQLTWQVFSYDTVNRLMLATEKPTAFPSVCPEASSQWCERFSYDDYGNRSMPQTSYTGLVVPQSFSTANNRILDAGYGYDSAGNLNQDGVSLLTYKYDAENRLVASCANDTPANCTNQVAPGRTLYGYDGDGRRVTKRTPSGALTTYIYDASGELAAEYGTPGSTSGPEYLTADQLGSTRVITNASGAVLSRHDFRPFGDEIPVTTGSPRQGVQGYGLDASITQKFTGKERDAETGLDFSEARYFSGAQGRFTSPDEPLTDQDPRDPQSWNLYSYVRNNPLRNLDPSGHDCITASNQTDTTVTVSITSGACNGNQGAYVNGTVDRNSLTYNGTSVGYSYTSYDANTTFGGGTVNLGRAPSDALSSFAQRALGQAGVWATDGSIFREGLSATLQILAMIDGVKGRIEEGELGGGRTTRTGESTGRATPANLKEQLALDQVKSNPLAGKELTNIKMKDTRWPASQGWVKMEQKVNDVTIHYVRNTKTGAVADFKFK